MINIIILILIVLIPVSFICGYFIKQSQFNKTYNEGTGKFGVIHTDWYGKSISIEIEELLVAVNKTKVRIVAIEKDPNLNKTNDQITKFLDFQKWVNTKDITWYDNNTQNIRKGRLDKLLKT